MMSQETCPACGKAKVVHGEGSSARENSPNRFCPSGTRFSYTQVGVLITTPFRACVACGHFWSRIDPASLRAFIHEWGEEIARQELDESDFGIYRDLPDTAFAREIAEKVAEIDRLVRDGTHTYVGRYRALKEVIWDQAIKETRDWHRLTRPEKLALFGWEPKQLNDDGSNDPYF